MSKKTRKPQLIPHSDYLTFFFSLQSSCFVTPVFLQLAYRSGASFIYYSEAGASLRDRKIIIYVYYYYTNS